MPLELIAASIENVTRNAVFDSLTLSAEPEGMVRVNGRFRIELRGDKDQEIASPTFFHFNLNSKELFGNSDFQNAYSILQKFAYQALSQQSPELLREK